MHFTFENDIFFLVNKTGKLSIQEFNSGSLQQRAFYTDMVLDDAVDTRSQ